METVFVTFKFMKTFRYKRYILFIFKKINEKIKKILLESTM